MSSQVVEIIDLNWTEAREKLDQEIETLEKSLNNVNTEKERVDILFSLAERLRVRDIDRTTKSLREAIKLAHSANYTEGWVLSVAELVRYSMSSTELETAEKLCNEADELLKDCQPGQRLAYIDLKIGWMFYFFGEYSMAMDWGLKGVEIAHEYGTSTIHARLLDLIACIHSLMNDHPSAMEVHAEALTLAQKSTNPVVYASILNNFAMTYFEAGEFEQALQLAQPCVEIGRKMGMTRLIQNFFDTESEILLAMGRLEEAEKVLLDALALTRNTPMEISKGYITRTLGKVNLKKGKLKEAGEYLEQAIDIMVHLNMRGGLAECHQLMSSVNEQQGNFADALEHYKKYYELNEATSGKESARQQAVLKAGYDIQLAQRDAEIERLRNFELTAEIEDRKHVQEVLERLATTDMLTNLTNRHHFFILAEREVERALRYKHPLAMLIIDIDLFKNINDTFGHIAGDQVLVAVSQMIHTSMRNLDIAGRYGGDEFCVLLPETDINQALHAAERLRSAIADLQVTTNNGQASVTVSVGVAEIRKHIEVITEQLASRELARMLDHADQALYNAKKNGRNSTSLFNANRRVTLKKNQD